MKLKKLYKHDNKKKIWRILPAENKKLVIEERDSVTKEVFFNCLDIQSGKKIFSSVQLDEKNWIGIEAIYKEIIFFHTYGTPDMPAHKSIIAFDIKSQTILWQNDNYVFNFVFEDKIYCIKEKFESRDYYALDYLTGNVIDDLGDDALKINELKEKADKNFFKQNYVFPEYFSRNSRTENEWQKYLSNVLTDIAVKGDISYLMFNDLLMFNYHEVSKTNTLNNIFKAVDLSENKIVLKETLDKNLVNLMPESFFIKDEFLFLIVNKTKLLVYSIKS